MREELERVRDEGRSEGKEKRMDQGRRKGKWIGGAREERRKASGKDLGRERRRSGDSWRIEDGKKDGRCVVKDKSTFFKV